MGRAAEAEVVALAPVVLVVPALVARPRPVGDLVPGEPGRLEGLVGELVAPRLDVVVGMALRVAPKRRARLGL